MLFSNYWRFTVWVVATNNNEITSIQELIIADTSSSDNNII